MCFNNPTCLLTENSLLRYVSEDKGGTEEYHTGRRSSRRSRRKSEKGGSPAHYALVPTLQMDMLQQDSLTTPTSETSSVYLVSILKTVYKLLYQSITVNTVLMYKSFKIKGCSMKWFYYLSDIWSIVHAFPVKESEVKR